MPGKQSFENSCFKNQSFPSNFKFPKAEAVRSFPVNCGATASATAPSDATCSQKNAVTNSRLFACCNSPSKIKFSKVDVVRDFPKHCGPLSRGSRGRECGQSSDVKSHRHSDGAKYVEAIRAVPLRSVPTIDAKWDPEEWKCYSEKLGALIAEAKECINASAIKFSYSKEVHAVEDIPEESEGFNQQTKRVRKRILDEQVAVQNLGESLSQKRMIVFDRVSKIIHKQEASGLGSECKDEDEVCVLSPAEWNVLQSHSKHEADRSEASIGKTETKSQGIEIVDLVDLCDEKSKGVSDCGLPEIRCGEKHNVMDLDEFATVAKNEPDESLEEFSIDDCNAIVKSSDIGLKEVVNGSDVLKSYENKEELINLMIVQHEQPHRLKVIEALELFEEQYMEILKEQKAEHRERKGTKCATPHFEAAARVKAMGMFLFVEKPFGHILGVEIGDEFQFRAELAVVGIHRQLISGIDYVVLDGKKFATSVVDSGRYENEAKTYDVLIYSGQGGNLKNVDKAVDQKLEKGNLALVNSMEMGYPVRVTYKKKRPVASKTLGVRNDGYVYVYDGLYMVNGVEHDSDQNGKKVYKFELHRMPGQPLSHQSNTISRKLTGSEVCVLDDVSEGKENMPIRAMNGVDDDRPPRFVYGTHMVYPPWYQCIEPIGCDCTDGCSDSQQCPCVLNNGGEIPFNENGAIVRAKPRVHECGYSCKCPPSCMNRVSQHGPRYQLEIFKTEKRGWGVRSRNYISSGSFICEYVGEVLHDKEAEQRVGDDEYLFDIYDDGFAIDACAYGNVGRFINHSCSPNLYAQEVLYDNDDEKMPHIMFFATKNIPPLQELSYDYNYKIGRVCDVNGNIKMKDCYCGSRKCTGRMY